MTNPTSLSAVYEGWDGYQTSLALAISPLSPQQLDWRESPGVRSIRELARHISAGRVNWFVRMGAPGSAELAERIQAWERDADGDLNVVERSLGTTGGPSELVEWLEASWKMIDLTLKSWDVADLRNTYAHRWNGQTYAVSRQWTVWRIMAHDIHHGGQIARILALQNIEAFELRGLGGHIIMPPLAGSPGASGS